MATSEPLQVTEFADGPETLPLHVDYHEYAPTTTSQAATSFRIDSPGAGALLDSEVWIEYNLKLTADVNNIWDVLFGGIRSGVGGDPQSMEQPIALRQGFPFHRIMQSIALNINGTTHVQRPDRYSDQVLRFYAQPDEVSSVMSSAGGELDDGFGFPITRKAVGYQLTAAQEFVNPFGPSYQTITANNRYPQIEVDPYFVNDGLWKRHMRFKQAARWEGGLLDQVPQNALPLAYNQEWVFKIWERLPISPFYVYEARDIKQSIPHINQMTIDINWNSGAFIKGQNENARSMLFQSMPINTVRDINGLFTPDWFSTANQPKLHMKWYIPPMGYKLPPQISIPLIDYLHQAQVLPQLVHTPNAKVTENNNATYNNIRLEQIPDYLYIYICPDQSLCEFRHPSEFMLEIKNLSINIDGDAGKMIGATSVDLYQLYLKNAMGREMIKDSYDHWRKHHCLVVLKPEDMGLRYDAGVRHAVTLNITVSYRSWWQSPQYAADNDLPSKARLGGATYNLWNDYTPYINVLAEYRKYRLTLTESGGSKKDLLSLPKQDLNAVLQSGFDQAQAQGLGGLL